MARSKYSLGAKGRRFIRVSRRDFQTFLSVRMLDGLRSEGNLPGSDIIVTQYL